MQMKFFPIALFMFSMCGGANAAISNDGGMSKELFLKSLGLSIMKDYFTILNKSPDPVVRHKSDVYLKYIDCMNSYGEREITENPSLSTKNCQPISNGEGVNKELLIKLLGLSVMNDSFTILNKSPDPVERQKADSYLKYIDCMSKNSHQVVVGSSSFSMKSCHLPPESY